MNKDVLVWDGTLCYDLQLSKQLNTPWFGQARIISNLITVPQEIVQTPNKKIALVNYFFGQGEKLDLSWANLVVCLNWELINEEFVEHYNRARQNFNNDNIIFILGGFKQLSSNSHPRFLMPYLSFFNKVVQCNDFVDYNYSNTRPYIFDALLGSIKFHRKILFDKLSTSGLLEKSLVSLAPAPCEDYYDWESDYNFTITNFSPYTSKNFDQYEDKDVLEFKQKARLCHEIYSTADVLENRSYKGMSYYNPSMSFIIPEKIYKNTWYSLIAETNFEEYKFITEKTAKPLFAKRIFICFGSQGHLSFLRELGYKTFDSIIDESYDNEPDHVKRFKMAWQQVLKLADMDPVETYRRAMPILNHNFDLVSMVDKRMQMVQAFIQDHWTKMPL